MTKKLSERWKALPEKDKESFVVLAAGDKKRHTAEYEAWKIRCPEAAKKYEEAKAAKKASKEPKKGGGQKAAREAEKALEAQKVQDLIINAMLEDQPDGGASSSAEGKFGTLYDHMGFPRKVKRGCAPLSNPPILSI